MSPVSPAVSQQLTSASGRQHRQLFILSGPEAACVAEAQGLLRHPALSGNPVWLGNGVPVGTTPIAAAAINTLLGSEISAAVINTFSGFECDDAAALEGTIVAGGALILLTPELDRWARHADPSLRRVMAYEAGFTWPDAAPRDASPRTDPVTSPFIERFIRLLSKASASIGTFTDGSIRALKPPATKVPGPGFSTAARLRAQHSVIRSLEQLPFQNQYRALLLTADRGRGKSAALGIAAARLSVKHDLRILVSGPGKRATAVLSRHWRDECKRDGQVYAHDQQVDTGFQFCPPDQLASMSGQADLLIIDEAASIPLPLLVNAALSFPYTVFATTTNGYEGAGRGFALRFTHLLSQQKLDYQQVTLEYPFRWAPGDPLEQFVRQAFLLDAPLNPVKAMAMGKQQTAHLTSTTRPVSPATWVKDEAQLRIAFGILLQAHYKTTPNDLRHMLDSHNLRSYILELEGQTVGAALLASEGPLTELALRQGVLRKRRRPPGHLLPQLLAQYTGAAHALDLQVARVVRIAIHPQCQRRGLGSDLLQALSCQLQQQGFDAIGAMFSAIPGTVRFWESNGYTACHLGARKQTSSGYRSISMLKPLSPQADGITQLAHTLYVDTQAFHAMRHGEAHTSHPEAALYDPFVLQRYVNGERTFMDSHTALARMASVVIAQQGVNDSIDPDDRRLLRELQSPEATVGQLAASLGLDSKKSLENRLRQIVSAALYVTAR